VGKVTEPLYSFMESDTFGKPSPDLGVMTRLWTGCPGVLRCPAEARGFSFPKLGNHLSSPIIIQVIKLRKMGWAGHVARMGERRGVYRVLVGKLDGKRPLGRLRHRWEDNIKMDLQELGCGGMD